MTDLASSRTLTTNEPERVLLDTQLSALFSYEKLVNAVNENRDRISKLKQGTRKALGNTNTTGAQLSSEFSGSRENEKQPEGLTSEPMQSVYNVAERAFDRPSRNSRNGRRRKTGPKELEFMHTIAEADNEKSPIMSHFVPCFVSYEDTHSSVNLAWEEEDTGPDDLSHAKDTEELQWILSLAEKQIDSLQFQKDSLKRMLQEKEKDMKRLKEGMRQRDFSNAHCKAICDRQRSRICALERERQELVSSLAKIKEGNYILGMAGSLKESASEETVIAGNTKSEVYCPQSVCDQLELKIHKLEEDKTFAIKGESEASSKYNQLEQQTLKLKNELLDQQTQIDSLQHENTSLGNRMQVKEAEVARLLQLVEEQRLEMNQCNGLCVNHKIEAVELSKKLTAAGADPEQQAQLTALYVKQGDSRTMYPELRKDDLLRAEFRIQKLRLLLALVESHQNSKTVCCKCNRAVVYVHSAHNAATHQVEGLQIPTDAMKSKNSGVTTSWLKEARNAIKMSNKLSACQSDSREHGAASNESLTMSPRMLELIALLESHGTFIKTPTNCVQNIDRKEMSSDIDIFYSFDVEDSAGFQ